MKKTVITNAVIFTVNEKDEIIKNGTVVIEDGKIIQVGKGRWHYFRD